MLTFEFEIVSQLIEAGVQRRAQISTVQVAVLSIFAMHLVLQWGSFC